jgi:hypothetical protein
MSNPYVNLEDYRFWSRAMSRPGPSQIDPCVSAATISPSDKLATMGSCFAQHLARFVSRSGLNYYVPEAAPTGMSAAEATHRNYGVFSARYGNVYTVKQAVQLFDRAFGAFVPQDNVWKYKDRLVDPFRPRIEPEGFATEEDLERDRQAHFRRVRDVFIESDFIIFTLGLTEGWRSRRDGAVFPLAPGVAGGNFDPEEYEFVNFTVPEIERDLTGLITKIDTVNPYARIILTVSPVPLIATYENRHVLVSTTYSKAALRVAADAAERSFHNVTYFPSYEIITSPAAQGRYYADDLREVTDLGVKHVMRVFAKHFFEAQQSPLGEVSEGSIEKTVESHSGVVCDEETIELARRQVRG